MSPALVNRVSEILPLSLKSGNHASLEQGMCVMEAASYIAGEPWSDHPTCTCPVITSFMIVWNDGLPNDTERDRLLKPLIERVIGTRSTAAVEERRSYLALDWLIRVYTPKFLDLLPSLAPHAKSLRELEEIVDLASATAARKYSDAAGTAARAAARDAARDAAGDAAWTAAAAAARDAAGAAAWTAAGDAAWAAAKGAAWTAAGEAAWAAARGAAGDALKPAVEWLQVSALDLVNRMIGAQP